MERSPSGSPQKKADNPKPSPLRSRTSKLFIKIVGEKDESITHDEVKVTNPLFGKELPSGYGKLTRPTPAIPSHYYLSTSLSISKRKKGGSNLPPEHNEAGPSSETSNYVLPR
jgi:hypothetical protein